MSRDEVINTIWERVTYLKNIPLHVDHTSRLKEAFAKAFEQNCVAIYPGYINGCSAINQNEMLKEEEIEYLRERVMSRLTSKKEYADQLQKETIAEIRELLSQLEEMDICP